MKHRFLFTALLLINFPVAYPQILKGHITSQSGEPIQYSTVYIQELKQGTTSNTKGDYEISLPAGKYTVAFQSLGYQPVYDNITVSGIVIKNVVLPVQYYEIPEVRIMGSGEDPAYPIMRKAIGLAPYYLNNISYYKAEVYLKGNLVINKIPKLLQKSMKIETESDRAAISAGTDSKDKERVLKAGDSFLMESYNEIEFTAPDKYFQKVISINSTFPAQGNEISPMSFIQASFYQPVLADMAISPLAPNAFSHYNFKFLGASLQGNFTINKIQVIPKRKSQQLFEGTIYIIEDLWCLQSVDLTNENLVGRIRIQQLYIPVQDEIWLPVSHKFEVNIGIIGFKADAGYGSSVKYLEVRPNTALQKPASITADYKLRQAMNKKISDSIVPKSDQKINKILGKNQISNRDMAKLARLMEKASERSIDSSKKSLEIQDNTTRIVEKDANKKDSAYWANIRPIPLSDIELHTLKVSDSIKASKISRPAGDTLNHEAEKQKSLLLKSVSDIAFGHTWSDTTHFRFGFDGLIALKNFGFNSVDGFSYGMNFNLSKRWKNTNSFSFVPNVSWTFNREKLMWNINTTYIFNKIRHNTISFQAGSTSKDFSNGGGENPVLNTIYSLFFKKNYLKLYESDFMSLVYSTELANGLRLSLSGNYDNRKILQNSTNFSFLKSQDLYSDNIPPNKYLSSSGNELEAQKHIDFQTSLTYTPRQKYRMQHGSKIPDLSDWPTFELTWEHIRNEISSDASAKNRFDMLKLEISKNKTIGAFGNFKWRLRAAGYLDNRNLSFFDFFHINSQPLALLLNNYEDAFMIPSYYSLSTPDFYAEAHLKYTSPYLLLKLLPGLSNTLMRENISFSYLGSGFNQNYSEIGYSLSEILFIGELGVYVGFDDLKYRSTGLKVILNFR